MSVNQIKALMNPKSVAIVGASSNIKKMGSFHALSLVKGEFKGDFFPIHPDETKILGHKAYKKVKHLPKVPDLAVLVVPSIHVPSLLEDFGRLGTKSAIIITAGFKETGGKGVDLEEEIKNIALKYGMRFIGPNCIGIINSAIGLNTTVSPITPNNGRLGFISQSGTYVTQTLVYLKTRGIKLSKAVSVGNEANITMTDVLEYLGEDESTKAISLYIEGITDARAFLEVASKITPKKPILAQYTGGNTAGARASLSHTGALAAPSHLYDGLFKQAGIIRVNSIEELYSHGWVLATQPRLKGNKIGVVTNSGGPATAIASVCEAGGLKVPEFSKKLQQNIRPLVQEHAPCGNPVDLTFALNPSDLAEKIPKIIIDSKEADAVIAHGVMGTGPFKPMYPYLKEALNGLPMEDIVKFMEADPGSSIKPPDIDFPLIISSFFWGEDNCIQTYIDNNIPVFDSPEKAALGMLSLLAYNKILETIETKKVDGLPPFNINAREILKNAMDEGRTSLTEFEAKEFLSSNKISTSKEFKVETEDQLIEAVSELGFPVVLKPCSHNILHKTEKNLVFLNLNTKKEVITAFNELLNRSDDSSMAMVGEMVKGSREFVAGVTKDPVFGPCLLFGLGGIFTEALKDTTFRIAPISPQEAKFMTCDLKSKELLQSYRNMPAADTDAIGDILYRLGRIVSICDEIDEIDLNPIIIKGDQPVAVDALITLKTKVHAQG